MKRKKYLVLIIYMQAIDNGDANIENIPFKIQMIKALIEKLKTEPLNNVTNNKEIQRLQIRLNNYNKKNDRWKISRDVNLIKLSCAAPVASALRE